MSSLQIRKIGRKITAAAIVIVVRIMLRMNFTTETSGHHQMGTTPH